MIAGQIYRLRDDLADSSLDILKLLCSSLVPPKSPLTKTTRTAVYAAVVVNTSARLAFVQIATLDANSTVYIATSPNFADGLVRVDDRGLHVGLLT
jgi:hypothetical protein